MHTGESFLNENEKMFPHLLFLLICHLDFQILSQDKNRVKTQNIYNVYIF